MDYSSTECCIFLSLSFYFKIFIFSNYFKLIFRGWGWGVGGFNLPPIFKLPIIFIYEFLFLGFFYFFLHFIFLIFLSLFRRTSFFHYLTFIFFSISQSYIFLFLSNSLEVPTYFLKYFVQSYSFPSNIRNKKNTIYEWFPSNSESLD